MKGKLHVLILGLLLAFGLAVGQSNEEGNKVSTAPTDEQSETSEGAPAEEQTETTQESQPVEPGQDTDAQEDGAGEEGDPVEEAAEEEDAAVDTADQDSTEAEEPSDQTDATDEQGVMAALQTNPDFSTFANAIERAGLLDMLEQDGPFTILAPTNQAFEQAGFDIDQIDQEQLVTLIRNHVIEGMLSTDQLMMRTSVVTLLGDEYAVGEASGDAVAGARNEGEVAGGGAAEPAEPGEEEPVIDGDPTEVPEDAEPAAEDGGIPPEPVDEETETNEGSPAEEQTETTQESPPAEPAADAEGEGANEEGDPDEEAAEAENADAEPGDAETGDEPEDGAGGGQAAAATEVMIGDASVTDDGTLVNGSVVYGIDAVLVPASLDINSDTETEDETEMDTDTEDSDTGNGN